MDKRQVWMAVCAGVGALVGVAIGDVLVTSHAVGGVLAGLGGALGAIVGIYAGNRYAA